MPRRSILISAFVFGLFLGGIVSPASASSANVLRGSLASIQKQYRTATTLGFTAARNSKDIQKLVNQGHLVRVSGNRDYELGAVSFPYARPTTKAFIEAFAKEYRLATGEKLVVTSLARPLSRQPKNASDYSVHPMGMAVDFRRSNISKTRAWMERRLASLEYQGVIEATHERRPPHYHVAVMPKEVVSYAAAYLEKPVYQAPTVKVTAPRIEAGASTGELLAAVDAVPAVQTGSENATTVSISTETSSKQAVAASQAAPYKSYRVARGDTLWTIASKFETSVKRIRTLNGLRNSKIYPGQKLMVPGGVSG